MYLTIAYCLRNDAFSKPGGDSGKVEKYRSFLSSLGHQVLIFVSIDELEAHTGRIDVIHILNAQTPYENFPYFSYAKTRSIPLAFSPIHHQKFYMELYFKSFPHGRFLNYQAYTYLSSLVKELTVKKRFPNQAWLRSPNRINRQIIDYASKILPLSDSEFRHMSDDLGVVVPQDKVRIVPNALTFNTPNDAIRDIDVLVVGRIEPRKNQLKIAKALTGVSAKVTFVGKLNRNHSSYVDDFLGVVNTSNNLTYSGEKSQPELRDFYTRSKVCLSNSWFEVVSQVDLEAASLGCKVVVSRASAIQSYFKTPPIDLSPDCSSDEIRRAVDNASSPDYCPELKDSYLIGWPEVTRDLLGIYFSMLAPPAETGQYE